MKRCPQCRRDYYDETLLYCLDDGTALLDGPGSLDPPTAVLDLTKGEAPTRQQALTTNETALLTSHTLDNVPPGQRPTRKMLLTVGALILTAAVGFGGYKLYKSYSPAAPVRTNQAIKVQRLTGDGKVRDAKISPDGKFLAYLKVEGDKRSLWLKQIQTNSNIAIVAPGVFERFGGIAFSPDGSFVYFNGEKNDGAPPTVYRVPTLGGSATKVLTKAVDVQVSPDGSQLSFSRFDFDANETSVMIANTDGSNERKLAAKSGSQFYAGTPAWSADGKLIATAVGDDDIKPIPDIGIALISVADGTVRQIEGARFAGVSDVVWHPSGDSIIVAATDKPAATGQIFEIGHPDGTVRRLTNNLNGHYTVSLTSDGRSIVTGEISSKSAVYVSPDLKPENAKQVMPASSDTWGFSWTPDNRIVYISDQTGEAEVWIMDADGANAKQLTNDRVFKTTPIVSPDGRYIVYSTSASQGQLVRIGVDGGNPFVLVQTLGADNADISLDSKWVIFSGWTDGILKILRVPLEGGDVTAVTNYRATEPRYSRDGTKIACFIPDLKSQRWSRLAIIPAEGGDPLTVLNTPTNTNITRGPIWTPDDRALTVVIAPGELQNLWLVPVDGSEGKQMTNFGLPGVARRDYSRDGKRIALVRAEGFGDAIMISDFR